MSDDRRLYSLWQHAGAYFHGHSVGGTNPTLVQAMATRAPIVARDTPYNREVLGEAGLFTAPDEGSIARAVNELLGNPRAQEALTESSYRRFREAYTWAGVLSAYESALSNLAVRGRQGGSRSDPASQVSAAGA
ncbi:glycosyltransferase [Microbacterium yannicii]|uniref:glycosyltransferase n=1 Tax=Microbacterium yannicii TaxID=671622 RepID=UPI001ED99DA8|nr:glycosyltransferase [Microbacterium yannicii]